MKLISFRLKTIINKYLINFSSEFGAEVKAEAMEALATHFESSWASVGDQVL